MNDLHLTDQLIDEYLHGLLADADAAFVKERIHDDPIWAAALEHGQQRLALIRAACPPMIPQDGFVRQATQHILGAERSRRLRRKRGWAATVAGFAIAAAALFAVQLWCENRRPPGTRFEVLGQQALLADAPGSLRVRVINDKTGSPVGQVPVQLALYSRATQERVDLTSFKTDARGTGSPQFRMPDWPAGSYELIATADTADGPDILRQNITLKRDVRLMLSTDKPVYQPGQTIQSRALALRRPDLKPLADQPALFTLTDPKGNIIFKHEQHTSKFGIASCKCELATEINEGPYELRCQIGTDTSSAKLDVRKYVLPKFKVEVQFDKPYYKPGDKVNAKIVGTYFFGQPVVDGTVELEARTGTDQLIKRDSAKTTSDGTFPFTFAVPNRLTGQPLNLGDARITVTAVLRDTGGQEAGRTMSRVVTANDLRIEAIPEAGPLVPGLDNFVYVYVSTPDGRPVKAKVRVTCDGKDHEAATSELGIAAVPVRWSGDGSIHLTATDDAGRRAVHKIQPGIDQFGAFLVRADKAVYEAGETMNLVIAATGNQPIFIDLLRDGQTLRTETVDLKDGQGSLALDLPPELAGTLELCAYRINGNGSVVRKLRTLVVKPAVGINIAVKTDKPEYRPGETAKLEFALTDAKGQPAPGALSLAAVDEAVYSVLQERPGLEQAFYLLEQQLLKPVTTIYPWSLDEPLPAAQRNEFEVALFSATARVVSFEGERANLRSGRETKSGNPHTLMLESLTGKLREFEISKHRQIERVFNFWKALGIAGVLAAIAALWQWLGARIVLSGLALIALLVTIVCYSFFTLDARRELAAKADAAMVKLEGAMPPGRAESKPFRGVGNKAQEPLRVRDRFPETLLWRPELVTDDRGRATLELPLADSITTWRLACSAVSADGRLGGLQTGIRAFQPFFVDFDLPVSLTRGDAVTVPVVVSNFLDQPQTVTVTLKDAKWCERTGPATQILELPPRAVRSVGFPLTVRQTGQHQLEVEARGQGIGDAVKRTIEVIPEGRPVEQIFAGTLDKPATVSLDLPVDAIADSTRLLVRFYPSAFSQLVDGLDNIFQMPHGCFEQTSSTTYPNVLALDYLKRTKQSNPELETKARQYIHLGYQRLLSFERPGGGFDWYGTAPADVTLSAYGLMEFRDMAKVHDVDPNLLSRTRDWLLRQRRADGSWQAGRFHTGGAGQLMATAYVARAVFDGTPDLQADATRSWLLNQQAETINDAYTLANVVVALHATAAASERIAPYVNRLIALKKTSEDGKKTWWELGDAARTTFYGSGQSANVETTALAALALLKTGQQPSVVRGALTWLIAQKDARGTWHSTQATVLALQALTVGAGGNVGGEHERTFIVRLGDHEEKIKIAANQADVVKTLNLTSHWNAAGQQMQVQETTDTGSGYQVVARHHVAGPSPVLERNTLAVDLQYDHTDITVGNTIRATATLKNIGNEPAPMVILDLPIPGGFAVQSEDFTKLVQAGQVAKFDVTPRQVIVYLRELKPGQLLTLAYRLKATMPVTVAVPAAKAYEYYDPSRRGVSVGNKLVAK